MYYEGDRQSLLDVEVPPRPSATCVWRDGAWLVDRTLFNADIDARIEALERQVLIPRPIREGVLIVWAAVAQLVYGATLEQLLDSSPNNPKYHAGFARAYAFDQSIIALRAQRMPP
jgi:hypothetical protein